MKKRYFPDLGFVISRKFCGGDVTCEDLKIAIANIRERHKVKRPCACPSADVNDPRDMSDVDSRREELRIIENAFMKDILPVQPVQSIVSSYLCSMNGDDVPGDLLTVVTQEIIAKGFGFAGRIRGQTTAINNHGLFSYNNRCPS